MKQHIPLIPIVLCALFTGITACNDSGTDSGEEYPSQIETQLVEDVPADTGGTGEFTFYSLREASVVEDSASTEWDIAMAGTKILTNSGSSGPGNGGALILDVAFEEVTIAPSEGYGIDTDTLLAIPHGDENGWYNYTSDDQTPNHAILPIENKTIVLRTGDGEYYAKLRILSYYKGNPDISSNQQFPPEGQRHYTFEYTIQMNGSRELQ